jgi:glycosyltransferase involved in cell wall biosynthesis
VIHNGITIPENVSTKKIRNTSVIGSSGRFFRVKDYPLMVEVAKEVLKRTNCIRFELAGDGPELRTVQTMIQTYGLEERVLLRGFVKDMGAFYQGLDLYLNTSVHEGIPISVLEAMAYRLPIIAPKVGGLSEIIEDGMDGYLVENRSPKAFAEKCLQLFDDRNLREQMAIAAREKVIKEFSVEQMARRYYHLYLDIVRM